MRLLHTADWHIGQTLNGWTRHAEHAAVLSALPDVVEAHDVDALVVAGDIFDGVNPSAESQQLLFDTLIALHDRRPHLTTVLVAGNHDPAWRLEAPAGLLQRIGVHVVGVMHRNAGSIDLDRHLVPLQDRQGRVRAHVLAIPFLRASDLPGMGEAAEGGGSPIVAATRQLYAEAAQAARARAGDLPLLATGHLHCAGGLECEGAERRILVGGEHAVPHDVFPGDLAYVALGHLHRPQRVGRDEVRYSGSTFPLSATELETRHGLSLVSLDGARLAVEHLPLPRPVACHRIPQRGALPLRELEAALAALDLDPDCPPERRPFVHVVLELDGPAAGLAGEAEQVLERHPVRSAGIRVERPRVEAAAPDAGQAARSLAETDPADLFARAFEAANGVPPEPRHVSAFHLAAAGD
ncbi:MAG: exonuclease SbcCD subunit D [Alsobacter sp.]